MFVLATTELTLSDIWLQIEAGIGTLTHNFSVQGNGEELCRKSDTFDIAKNGKKVSIPNQAANLEMLLR